MSSPTTTEKIRRNFELAYAPITCVQDIRNLRQLIKDLREEVTLKSFSYIDTSFKLARNFITDQDDDYI